MSNPPEPPYYHPTPERLAESKKFGEFLLAFLRGEEPMDASTAATTPPQSRPKLRPSYLTVVPPHGDDRPIVLPDSEEE